MMATNDTSLKRAIVYGAGNIGRGFIGQLFSLSGYQVTFIDIDSEIIRQLNADGCYPIRTVANDDSIESVVEPVSGVNGLDNESVEEAIASSDLMATAVGAAVLPRIAGPIARGLKRRWSRKDFRPLNIILCENLYDVHLVLKKLILQELEDNERKLFDQTVGLVEASVGRMVPVMTAEMQDGNRLRIYVEKYCGLPVDRDAFVGEIPNIIHMIPYAPFRYYIQRKLYIHNMGHAVAAYLGHIQGDRFIWEVCKVPAIRSIVRNSMGESCASISRLYGIPMNDLLEHADDLLDRFGNQKLGDTIVRVARDPVRKLANDDRLVGAAKLCLSEGIKPVFICVGIAAALHYEIETETSLTQFREQTRLYEIQDAIQEICGIDPSNVISKLASDFYQDFKQGVDLDDILRKAEMIKVQCVDAG
ncbi:MAG: hypothetical protein WCG21_07100 [Eubacteriales bacterium]